MIVLHEIDESIEKEAAQGLAIALGYFDGIHIGHKKIINTLVQYSKQNNLKSAVITFSKNPANYFSDKIIPNIQSFKDRQIILESLGVDYLYELDFEKYKDLEACDYLKNILIDNLLPKMIIAGYNHTFGKDKLGTAGLLAEFSSVFGYECIITDEQKYHCENIQKKVSSSEIRKEIECGNLESAKELLGRSFSVRNSVVRGAKMASNLGYPTANIVWPDSIVKLPYGVYFGYVQILGGDVKMMPALISWSNKPTLTQGKNEFLEAHIYNFKENLYGKIINIIFEEKHRDTQNFGNVLVLKTQLQKDYSKFEKWARMMS